MGGSEAREGAIVGGRFRLERLLGEGGMGEVWSATDVETGAPRALKLLKRGTSDSDRRRRFVREGRAAMTIDSPHVVAIHAVEAEAGETPYLVMDLLEGETLRAHLDRHGRLSLDTALSLLMPVISAVSAAHAHGIVHRDLKPENVFLAMTPSGVDVRVLDFGVAKFTASLSTPALTESGDRLGTPRYMAPEQARGERDIDHRVDLWSLGIMLWEALAGRHPIPGESVGAIYAAITLAPLPDLRVHAPELPIEVTTLVTRMLARDPEQRPRDLREVAAVLVRHYGGSMPELRAAEGTTRALRRSITTVDESADGTTLPSRARERSRAMKLVLFVALLLAAAVTFAVVLRGGSSARPPSTSP